MTICNTMAARYRPHQNASAETRAPVLMPPVVCGLIAPSMTYLVSHAGRTCTTPTPAVRATATLIRPRYGLATSSSRSSTRGRGTSKSASSRSSTSGGTLKSGPASASTRLAIFCCSRLISSR